MGHLIRQNRNIKRIEIGKETVCLLQFADDTVISLRDLKKGLRVRWIFLSFYKIFRSKTKVLLNQSQKDWVKNKLYIRILSGVKLEVVFRSIYNTWNNV